MKAFIVTWFTCVLVAHAVSQENSGDTSRVYRVPEVVVTATRSPISLSDSPSPVDVITLEDIQRMNAVTVADVLSNSHSVFLNNYGAEGALKTVSLRGASSSHILVLLDGTRINSFQNGLVDLGLFPVTSIDRIEIVRGGSSALYGADALGGVVNIFTRRATSDLQFRAEGGAGSFGTQKYLVEAQGAVGALRLVGGYSNERGRDDYPFVFRRSNQGDTTLRRENADFRRFQPHLSGSMSPDEHSSVTFTIQHVHADRGAPGPFFGPGLAGGARQSDDDLNLVVNYFDSHLDGVEFEVHSGFHYALQRYVDPGPLFPFDSYYRNRFFTINPHMRISLGSFERLIVGAEYAQGQLDDFSMPASKAFDGKIRRVQKSMYVSHESQFEFPRSIIDRISLYQTVRYDGISDVAHAITPKFGLNVRVSRAGTIHFRTSIGQSFRVPTFNDLYYRGFSNRDLKPERSTSFDVGVTSEVEFGGRHELEVTYFHLDTENRILFDFGSSMPVNIGKAVAQGLETKYTGKVLGDFLLIGAAYTLNDARKKDRSSAADATYDKQLKFVPRYLAHLSVSVHLGLVTLNAAHSIAGRRFTDDDNSTSLDPYRLTHVNAIARIPVGTFRTFAKVEVNNVFDRDYEVFPLYPMPKRNYRVTVGTLW